MRLKDLEEFKIEKPDPKDTMGVKRLLMPQVATKDYEELFKYLKDNGATFIKDTVPARTLKATQSEFSDQGVEKQIKKNLKDKVRKSIIVSSDDYVIDGHHRWLVALNTNQDLDIIRVNIPGNALLSLIKEFPKTTYKDVYTEDTTGKPHLYLDMDGVQADFFSQWAKWHSETTGKRASSYQDIGDGEAQLASIVNMSNQGPDFVRDFFANLPPLNGFSKVMNWIKQNNIPYSILSAPLRGNNKASIEGKKEWLLKHNPGAEQEIFTGNKENYASSGGQANVLIDDHGKYIKRWTSNGGIGIKHSNNNPQATISALEKIYSISESSKNNYGIPDGATLAQLDSIAKNAKSKEKRQRAHWLRNMRRGANNKK